MPLTGILAVSGVLLGLLLIIALLVRQDANRLANLLLAGFMGCTLCYLIVILSLNMGLMDQYPQLALLARFYLLSSPLLYGYTLAMTQRNFTLRLSHLLHLWPVVLVALILPDAASNTVVTSEALEDARGGWPPNRTATLGLYAYTVSMLYLTLALLQVRRHDRQVVEEFSFKERVALRWLKILIWVSLLLATTGLLLALVRLIPGVDLWSRSLFSTGGVMLTYYLITFFGLSQPDVFAGTRSQDEPSKAPDETAEETGAHDLDEEWETLERFMHDSKPYLEHELRIADLAERTGIPTWQLSQVINQQAGKNFFDYVSSYRITYAKQLLSTTDSTMANLAQAAGFNSQSAFYRQFKKVTGLAPKQFQRQHSEEATQSSP